MNRISSKATFFQKRIFPIFWFGLLVVFVATGLMSGIVRSDLVFLIVPSAMAILGYALMRYLV